MKSAHLKFLVALTFLPFLVACGGNDDKKKEYFIVYKMDGARKIFQMNDPGYQACGTRACVMMPPFSSEGATFYVSNETEDFSASDIEDLAGVSLEFTDENFPNAIFAFSINGVSYSSVRAAVQNGTFTIMEVEPDGMSEDVNPSYVGHPMYKVTGTFQCNVRSEDGDSDIAITEGKFVIRLSESQNIE